jgi:hypothetical protein
MNIVKNIILLMNPHLLNHCTLLCTPHPGLKVALASSFPFQLSASHLQQIQQLQLIKLLQEIQQLEKIKQLQKIQQLLEIQIKQQKTALKHQYKDFVTLGNWERAPE